MLHGSRELTEHTYWMEQALELARQAGAAGEIPVGAVIVDDQDNVLAKANNRKERDGDPLAHAEILAIQQATRVLQCRYLLNCRLYVTLEPCPMCAGAIVLARLGMVIYGAADSKTGAMGSVLDIPRSPAAFHSVTVIKGVKDRECRELMQSWFRQLRAAKKQEKG
ncbi:MAG: tRNA adenosine(34) deaminase TadA [Pseudanabaenaceae cyanobacterium SKYGB_i_bin29]|nr:tRNA adenosine(34) deaminase TadA [Pseudanabaenaceae cyanobacterium SKYG29]MDW8420882.1 tRNA adenosine(34) deaminase TadA [Pseudanabaenaceae cyanobacterium SKYGB_i_bin29]